MIAVGSFVYSTNYPKPQTDRSKRNRERTHVVVLLLVLLKTVFMGYSQHFYGRVSITLVWSSEFV